MESLERRQRAIREKEKLKAFESRRNTLESYVQKIAEKMKTLKVLREMDIVQSSLPFPVDHILSVLQEFQQQFQSNSEMITEQNSLDSIKHNLDSLYKKLHDFVAVEWRKYCQLNMPPIREEVLQVLSMIPSYKDHVSVIRNEYRLMLKQAEEPPRQVVEVQMFSNRRVAIDLAWEKLGHGELPASVLHFLRLASSNQGVSLDLFTDEVREWLLSHQLSQHFRICLMA